MRNMTGKITATVVVLTVLAAFSSAQADDIAKRLQAHVEFLADDLLQGREAGTPQHEIAAHYVASQLKALGLEPGGEDGSYFQWVPLQQSWRDPEALSLVLHAEAGDISFQFPRQTLISSHGAHPESSIRAPLVFVGYGIEAPPLDYNNYDGVDVEGKIVVALSGKPDHFPSEEGSHFASGTEKLHAAVRHGAIGYISIHTPKLNKRVTFERMSMNIGKPAYTWVQPDGSPYETFPELQVRAHVRAEEAAPFFAQAALSLEALFGHDEANTLPSGFALNLQASMAQRSRHDVTRSPNVAAILPGSHPELKHEFVIYSAHLDHVGLSLSPADSDKIRNGALDNASGVAIMLETARILKESRRQPKRSVLFLAVTAEEKGLLGAEYYARYPTIPAESMVANINLDMPLILYPLVDVIAFGAEHSTLHDATREAAENYGIKLSPDPWPEQGIFTRSDHYMFVKQGVPSIYLVPGISSDNESIDAAAIFGEFIRKHYHKPSDQTDLPIDYQAGATFTRINADIGLQVANQRKRPKWNKGDFFGDTFGK